VTVYDRCDDPAKPETGHPLAVLTCREPERKREPVRGVHFEVRGERLVAGTEGSVKEYREKAEASYWSGELFRAWAEKLPRTACLFDLRTPRNLEFALGSGEAVGLSSIAPTLRMLAPMAGHVKGWAAHVQAVEEGLEGRIHLPLVGR
jgi:hypothetical protein